MAGFAQFWKAVGMAPLQITDDTTGSSAWILPDLGFNCFAFRANVNGRFVDVLDAVPGFEQGTQRPTSSGIPILFPFPNRIRAGRFTWRDREYVLPGTDRWGNAIHGFCHDRPWRVTRHSSDFVSAAFQLSIDAPDRLAFWPADFLLEVDYELLGNRLRTNIRINNPGTADLPWGLGTHPYFKVPLTTEGRVGNCLLEVPAAGRWELENCLPTGRILPVDEACDLQEGAYVDLLKLDDVLTQVDCAGPQFDCVLMDELAGLQVTLTCPPIFREIVVFTPPQRHAICAEPYTCVTDAINLESQGIDAGWRVLPPGGEFHTWIDLTVGPILT